MKAENIKIIFGLKIKQIRTDKQIQLNDLARMSGMSASYLNEIEKGKKYPKTDKIMALANALETEFDELVSLKLNRRLLPIGRLLDSKFLDEIPLELFGIETHKLIEIISNAPAKINAFISALIQIARNYNVRQESFYLPSLKAFQEYHDNYFEEFEQAADQFRSEYQLDIEPPLKPEQLDHILHQKYNYSIDYENLTKSPELQNLRFVCTDTDPVRLFINPNLDKFQRAFVLGRQLGYNYLGLSERPKTSPMLRIHSFDQALNNFKASYFSGALLLNKRFLIPDIREFFKLKTWQPSALLEIMHKYTSSPDMFMQRLTNLLPSHFGLTNLFFMRIRNQQNTTYYSITKELHFSQMHSPHANELEEHYCRRWITIQVLQNVENERKSNTYKGPIAGIQRCVFSDTGNEYLVISIGRTMVSAADNNYCVGIGFLINNELKKKIRFWNDPAIPVEVVNETCERCNITDCQVRAAAPSVVNRKQRLRDIEGAIVKLSEF